MTVYPARIGCIDPPTTEPNPIAHRAVAIHIAAWCSRRINARAVGSLHTRLGLANISRHAEIPQAMADEGARLDGLSTARAWMLRQKTVERVIRLSKGERFAADSTKQAPKRLFPPDRGRHHSS